MRGCRNMTDRFYLSWCCCWCVLVEVVWNRLPETVRVRYTKTCTCMVVVFPK